VINVNDNSPQFSASSYEGNFPESTPVGTTLLKVKATDADDNKLIYSLPSCCNSATTMELFEVNPETGCYMTLLILEFDSLFRIAII